MGFQGGLATLPLGLAIAVLEREVWDVTWVCIGVCVLLVQGGRRLYLFCGE